MNSSGHDESKRKPCWSVPTATPGAKLVRQFAIRARFHRDLRDRGDLHAHTGKFRYARYGMPSATKYIGGHSDVMFGTISANAQT
jgi:hypothetical protein